jgi:glycosyltransferase involved in cell wall biosynthesis
LPRLIAALDATPLTTSSGGIRRYTEELTRALKEAFPEDQYHLISDQVQPVRGIDRKWWTIGVQRVMSRLNCELFHGVEFSVPYAPLRPSVLSLHDLSPWMNPEWHRGAGRVRRRTPYLIKLGIATMILTDTEAIRKEAIDFFGIEPSRIAAVHLAASAGFHRVECAPDRRTYFVYVGVIEPRKNVIALVDAWRAVRARYDVDLVLAGRVREDGSNISPEPGLRILGEVPDNDLPALYSGAVACVYPSMYEGFGLPVLEAMQCGAPVIASLDPALMEVSQGAAIHVDASQLADAMEGLLSNDEARRSRSRLSLNRAADFSWKRTAERTRDVYLEAIRRFHG